MYLIYCDTLDSVQLLAKRIYNKITQDIIIITADIQVSGIGRNNRKWLSGKGGLYFTIVLKKIDIPHPAQLYIPLIISEYITNKFNFNCGLKWPNDIFVKKNKIGGILIDCKINGTEKIWFIGIGINYNNKFDNCLDDENYPQSIADITDKEIIFSPIIESRLITEKIINCIQYYNSLSIISEYSKKCICLNKKIVAIDSQGKTISGIADRIGDYGELILNNGQKLYSVTKLWMTIL